MLNVLCRPVPSGSSLSVLSHATTTSCFSSRSFSYFFTGLLFSSYMATPKYARPNQLLSKRPDWRGYRPRLWTGTHILCSKAIHRPALKQRSTSVTEKMPVLCCLGSRSVTNPCFWKLALENTLAYWHGLVSWNLLTKVVLGRTDVERRGDKSRELLRSLSVISQEDSNDYHLAFSFVSWHFCS